MTKLMISTYPFQAVPGMAQLSFPAGATIEAKSGSTQGGWIFGSYGGREGWFPESYVVVMNQQQQQQQQQQLPVTQQRRPESPPLQRGLPATPQHLQQSPNSARRAYLPSNTTTTNSTAVNRDTTSSDDDNDDGFPMMMGGVPGDLFEGAPKPMKYTTDPQQQSQTPSFLRDQEPEEAPVDIYRHAPARKQRNFYNADYSPEISVQITNKAAVAPTTPTYTPRKLTQVGPSPTSVVTKPDDFYKMHPGRAPGPSTADQAFELERAFDDMRGSETIQIAVSERKKKKFPYIPKSFKKAAQKTVNAVKKH